MVESEKERSSSLHVNAASQAVCRALRKGEIKKKPCEICGTVKTNAHHDNYNEPLNVRWFCSKHHKEWHKNNKAIARKPNANRRRGRMKNSKPNMRVFVARFPVELHKWLRMEMATTGESMSAITVKALEKYKTKKEGGGEMKTHELKAGLELAKTLGGVLAWNEQGDPGPDQVDCILPTIGDLEKEIINYDVELMATIVRLSRVPDEVDCTLTWKDRGTYGFDCEEPYHATCTLAAKKLFNVLCENGWKAKDAQH